MKNHKHHKHHHHWPPLTYPTCGDGPSAVGGAPNGFGGFGGQVFDGTPPRRSHGVNISVVNDSKIHTGYELDELVHIGQNFLDKILVHFWPGTHARLIPSKVILPRTHAIILMDDPDHNEDLGYHTLTPCGLPLSKVFVRPTLTSGKSITQVFTHVLAEMRVDPGLNLTAIGPNGDVYALEVCDPVEEDAFTLDGALVTNIVTPHWFESFHQTGNVKFDYMNRCHHPFMVTQGGHALIRGKADGGWQQTFGSFPKSERQSLHQPEARHDERTMKHGRARQQMHDHYLPKR